MQLRSEYVDKFASLFAGRTDCYGADWGECVRRPVTRQHFEDHLQGRVRFGIYPINEANLVKWGCIDIDVEDLPLAKNLWRALTALNLEPWIERSRSKGFHVWVFAESWLPAATMRRALLAACQIVDYTPREVNPKQASLDPGQVGNFVRLPYPEMGLRGRQVMLDHRQNFQVPLGLRTFLELVHPYPTAQFEAAAELWTPPREPSRKLDFDGFDGDVQLLVDRMRDKNRYALQMFEEGPLEGRDRSTFLAHFCHALAERGGFTPGEALVLLDNLDERLGKFVGRKDREDQLRKLVERAFA